MLGLLRAELLKAAKHYRLTSFLVWVYPVGLAAFYLIGLPMALLSPEAEQGLRAGCPGDWTADGAAVWSILFTFPGSVFGKLLPLSFMAVMFAGEYEWGTWKNLIPRNRRHRLLLSKMLALCLMVSLSFVVLSMIPLAGQTLGCRLLGSEAGRPLTGAAMGEFLRSNGQQALLGGITLVIMSALAALGALLTRSILGALLVSLGASLLDPLSIGALSIARTLLNLPRITDLYLWTTSYNLDNLHSWFVSGQTLTGLTPDSPLFTHGQSPTGSLAVLAVWILGLLGLAIVLFRRQDITS